MNTAGLSAWSARLEAAGAAWGVLFWRACWQGGLFILLAWLVCRLLPALSPRVRHGLWLLACLKMLAGLVWAAPLVLPMRLNALPPAFVAAATTPAVLSAPSLRGTGRDARGGMDGSPSFAMPRPLLSGRAILCGLWLCGVAFGLARMAGQARLLRRLCQRARSLDAGDAGGQARELGALLGLARLPRVAECDAVAAPLVVGILRPLVLLPSGFTDRFTRDETRLALAHELAHVRGGDLWLALIPALAQTLFFPFPPVWMACREWITARETLRDQDALRVTNAPAAVYGNLLLKLVAQDSALQNRALYGALGAAANYHALQRRLEWMRAGQRQAAHGGTRVSRLWRPVLALLALPVLALFTPWRIQAQDAPPVPVAHATLAALPASPADPARLAALDLRAGGDPRKRYLLIGTGQAAPQGGYHLLIVLPGGDGGAGFQAFVKRVHAFGLPPDCLIAELIAPRWTKAQAQSLVWPTRSNTLPGVGFSTEAFVEDTIRDVQSRYAVNGRYVFMLGWASGGPACYATSLQPVTQTRGAFIAMSVFVPNSLPPLNRARARRFFLQQPLDADMAPLTMAAQARAQLRARGAEVELVTVEGGYGWHKSVYSQIRRGMDWLERP